MAGNISIIKIAQKQYIEILIWQTVNKTEKKKQERLKWVLEL